MSQSRFSIVLVGVSALLRRPLVSRLRPADGERSSWVVFAARVGRFDSGFRSAGWRFRLPLRRWPPSELAFGLTASAFRPAPLRGCSRRVGSSAGRVGLRAHCFRFSARATSEWPLGELAFGFTASAFWHAPLRRLPPGGLAFGLIASAFRHAPIRSCRSAGCPSGSLLPLFGTHHFGVAAGRVGSSAFRFGNCLRRIGASAFRFGVAAGRAGLRAHCFRFSACAASEWPLGEFVLPPSVSELPFGGLSFGLLLPLFGMHRFGMAAGRVRSSAFRFGDGCRAGWPSGSLLPLFGMRRFGVAARRVGFSTFRFGDCPRRVGLRAHCFRFSVCADPHRRAADARTDGAHRYDTCFTSKHLSQHVNLPHRSP